MRNYLGALMALMLGGCDLLKSEPYKCFDSQAAFASGEAECDECYEWTDGAYAEVECASWLPMGGEDSGLPIDTGTPTDTDTDSGGDTSCESSTYYIDYDGDSFGSTAYTIEACEQPAGYVTSATDCDDGNASVNPSAIELCDDVDNDCDNSVDEDAADAGLFFADEDGDGYGTADSWVIACETLSGYVDNDGDCDDGDATAYPDADELCDDVDNDCDGTVDEDVVNATTWYADADSDGYGDADAVLEACDMPDGYVANSSDCVDSDASIGATLTWYMDDDGDGLGDASVSYAACEAPTGYVADATDCVDSDATIGATRTWYADSDSDSYGDAASSTSICAQPSGYVADATDCNDASASYHPGAAETDCTDPADYNCDGSTGYADADGDGYAACEDCDDGAASVNDDAEEICDDVDNDCDGTVDFGASDAPTWYPDADSDGHGDDSGAGVTQCDAPALYAPTADDCDDGDATTYAGATEDDCTDPVDHNCDGSTGYADEDGDGYAACEDCVDSDAAIGATRDWYADSDSDGYGDAASGASICAQPSGYVDNDEDCDDSEAAVSPEADEVCDSADNDCDGTTDESDAVDARDWYADTDGDSYGDAEATPVRSCAVLIGYSNDADDCNDVDAAVSPEADEVCDDVDNNCNGGTDEDAVDASSWYIDRDEDGEGRSGTAAVYTQCADPSTATDVYADNADDCADTNDTINTSAVEIVGNAIDDDCDGTAE